MDSFKILVFTLWLMLLLAGGAIWGVGWLTKSQSLKGFGFGMLGLWALWDLVCLILIFCFGWFP
jgi:hypothetical protein